jgi:hypothetical protein
VFHHFNKKQESRIKMRREMKNTPAACLWQKNGGYVEVDSAACGLLLTAEKVPSSKKVEGGSNQQHCSS